MRGQVIDDGNKRAGGPHCSPEERASDSGVGRDNIKKYRASLSPGRLIKFVGRR